MAATFAVDTDGLMMGAAKWAGEGLESEKFLSFPRLAVFPTFSALPKEGNSDIFGAFGEKKNVIFGIFRLSISAFGEESCCSGWLAGGRLKSLKMCKNGGGKLLDKSINSGGAFEFWFQFA